LTVRTEEKPGAVRSRPSSLYTSPSVSEQVWLGVVSEEFADFERIPQNVSDPAAQGGYPKSAVSASSTIIPDGIVDDSLLLIVFDGVSRAHVHDVGVLTEFFTRTPLT
jgi:hypothetical protein